MDKASRTLELFEIIQGLGYECALVGGLAVSIRTRERFTKDIDLVIAVANDREAEALAQSMQSLGFDLLVVVEQEAQGLIATLRFRAPKSGSDDPSIDLILASCGIEPEIVAGASTVKKAKSWDRIRVATVPHLIAMKVLSESPGRPEDATDLRLLLSVATDSELAEARKAIALIEERGFNREKDLQACLASYLGSS